MTRVDITGDDGVFARFGFGKGRFLGRETQATLRFIRPVAGETLLCQDRLHLPNEIDFRDGGPARPQLEREVKRNRGENFELRALFGHLHQKLGEGLPDRVSDRSSV